MMVESLCNEREIAFSELAVALLTKNLLSLSNCKPELAEQLRSHVPHKKLKLFRDDQDFVNGSYLIDRNYEHFFNRNPKLET